MAPSLRALPSASTTPSLPELCHEVGYQEPEHIPPLGVLQAHADNRGWRGIVLLNPQPDSAAVHLIALPQHGHLVSVALLVDNRIVPCCVPRRARWRDLRGITFEGVRGRLDLPSHIDVAQDTVTFRSGDCFRVDTTADHTPESEFARLEEVDQETAEIVFQDTPAGVSHSQRQVPWIGCLLCVLIRPLRLDLPWWWVAGFSLTLAMHRPGSFPWQLPPHVRNFRLPDSDEPTRVMYYSPFVGTFPPYQAAPDTDHSVAWAQFLNDDAAWAVDFFPVWPGLHFNAMAFVPVGGDASTVTAILHYDGFARAVLMPRTVTDSWLQSFASHQVSADIGSIHLPHALEIWRFYDVPPPDCRLRNGDVLYLYDSTRRQDPLEFEEPWDIQTSGTGQHAPWAVGFRLDSDTEVDLLRPGQCPTPVTVPAGETWAPVQCTFSGDFHLQHPGMWTPVQWTASATPQLMQAHGVAAYANVVVATATGRRVRHVPRTVDRDALAACTDLHRDSITLGGVTDSALDSGVEIRNGDVIFGQLADRSAALPGCQPFCWAILLMWGSPLLWQWPFLARRPPPLRCCCHIPWMGSRAGPTLSVRALLVAVPAVVSSFLLPEMAPKAAPPSPSPYGIRIRKAVNIASGVSCPEGGVCRCEHFVPLRAVALVVPSLTMPYGPSLPARAVHSAVAGRWLSSPAEVWDIETA